MVDVISYILTIIIRVNFELYFDEFIMRSKLFPILAHFYDHQINRWIILQEKEEESEKNHWKVRLHVKLVEINCERYQISDFIINNNYNFCGKSSRNSWEFHKI